MADDDASVDVGVNLNLNEEQIVAIMGKIVSMFQDIVKAQNIADVNGQQAFRRMAGSVKEVTRETDKADAAMKEFVGTITENVIKAVEKMKALGHEVQVIKAEVRSSSTQERQARITARAQQEAAARFEIEKIRAVSKIEFAEIQARSIAQKEAAQTRYLIWQNLFGQLTRLEKAFGAVIAGTARTAVSAVSKSFDALGATVKRIFQRNETVVRNFDRTMNTSLTTSLRTRERELRTSFTRQEQILSRSAARQQATLATLRNSTATGVLGATSGRGIGPGIAAVAGGIGVAQLISLGFERFSNIERINKQFEALTGSVEKTEFLLNQVKEFAKTTPFDLVGVADLAKGFLAIGTAVEDVMPQVTAIADAVALTGGGVDELNRIQRAIGQVVASGRLQGDELNQLAENLPGLNIRKLLADQLTGGDTALLVEMQEAGEISADMFVEGIITGLQQDERLTGASQDLAKTLSGRAANLRESWADFGAAIIGTVEGPLKMGILGIQTALQSMADFIKGEVSPGLMVLRDALKGAALGMLAIIAAKGAVEVVQLLGTSLKLALTPMGALIAAAALLGAAISVLYKRSIPFREAVDSIVDALRPLGETIMAQVSRAAEILGTVLTDTVVPALESAAVWLAEHILPAFEATKTFITDSFIPAIKNLSGTIADLAVRIGGVAVDAWDRLTAAARNFWATVEPFLRPLIDGAHSFVNAIGAVFTDLDFSGLRGGFADLLEGIVGTASNIKERVAEVLDPIIGGIQDFFREAFSGPNLAKYAKAFLNVVGEIGRVLGLIVSDPMLFKVVAAVAAAAAIIAARFVIGFGKGVIENIPELAGMIGNALLAALRLALNNLDVLFLAGVGAFGAIKLFQTLRAAFTTVGAQAGAGFASGFRASLSGVGGFTAGAVGGLGAVDSRASFRIFDSLKKEALGLQNQLRILGDPQRVILSPEAINRAKARVKELSNGLTDAELAGLRFRDRVGAAMTAVGVTARGLARIVTTSIPAAFRTAFGQESSLGAANLGNLFFGNPKNITAQTDSVVGKFATSFKNGFGQIKNGFSTLFAELKVIAQSQSVSLGRFIAGGIAMGLAAGVTGFAIGQSSSGGVGGTLLSLVAGGLTGAAVSGGNPVGAAVGVAAAGVGAAFAAFKRGADEAKTAAAEFAGEVANLVQTLINDLQNGLDIGTDKILSFKEALKGDAALEALHADLKPLIPTLQAIDIEFGDVVAAFSDGRGGLTLNDLWDPVAWSRLSESQQQTVLEGIERALRKFETAVELTNQEIEFGTVASYRAAEEAAKQSVGRQIDEQQALGAIFGSVSQDMFDEQQALGAIYRVKLPEDIAATEAALEALGKAQEHWNTLVDDHLNRVGFVEEAWVQVQRSVENALAPLQPQSTDQLVDAAILAANQIAVGFADAGLDTALGGFLESLTGVINQGITDGLINSEEDLANFTFPILQAQLLANPLGDPNNPDAQRVQDALIAKYIEIFDAVKPVISGVADQAAIDALAGLNAGLTEPGDLDPKLQISFSPTAAQKEAYKAQGQEISTAAVDGVVAGLNKGVPRVRSAAAGVATAMHNAMAAMLGIQSPSKVMFELGANVSEGFANGIISGTDMITNAATAAFSGVSGVAVINPIGTPSVGGSPAASSQQASITRADVDRLVGALSQQKEPIKIDQTFNSPVNSHAVATDLAWRLGR